MSEEEKICPILSIGKPSPVQCVGRRCRWYRFPDCAVFWIVEFLDDIRCSLPQTVEDEE